MTGQDFLTAWAISLAITAYIGGLAFLAAWWQPNPFGFILGLVAHLMAGTWWIEVRARR